jgi:hypothetical protein
MARRNTGKMKGEQYLANTNKMEVHNLDNEQTDCEIDKIMKAGHEKPYKSQKAANDDGYDNCAHCIGGSKS